MTIVRACTHKDTYTLLLADAREALSDLSPGVSCIITDPAYASLEKHRSVGTTTRLTDWFPVLADEEYRSIFRQMYRVLADNAHCYVLCDHVTMFSFRAFAEEAGFKFWKPIIWDKRRVGMGYHYRAQYECILFLEKGKRKLNNLGVPDFLRIPELEELSPCGPEILSFPSVRSKGRYPTEKPVDLLRVLVSQSTSPGELVLDPFMGSGATGEAALSLSRYFLGIDVSERAYLHTLSRLEALKAP